MAKTPTPEQAAAKATTARRKRRPGRTINGNTAAGELARRRQNHAADLRSLMFTFDQIADALLPCTAHARVGMPPGEVGCPNCLPMYADRSGARRAVEAVYADERQEGAEARAQAAAEHLRSLQVIVNEGMVTLRQDWRITGDTRWSAARTVIRALDQIARIRGLYAPTQVQITTELDEQIRAELELLGLNDPVPS
jgi:hypothetical protein